MTTQFDPYREWLGLEVGTELPSHYQLLGLVEFESDAAAIAAAADQRMKEVRQYQTGPRGRFTQKILNELASAKLCLLDARTKKTYDAFLQGRRSAGIHLAPVTPVMSVATATSYLAEPPIAPPATASPPVAPPPAKFGERSTRKSSAEEQPSSWPWLGVILLVMLLGGTIVVAGVVYSKLGRESTKVSPVVEQPPEPPPPGRRDMPLPDEIVISQEGNGDLNFPMAAAELVGGLERKEQAGATALSAFDEQDAIARWRFKLVRPAIFKVQINYTASKAEGAKWKFTSQNDNKSRDVENGTTTDEFFWKVTTGGEQTLELEIDGLPKGAMLELQSLRFLRQDAGRVK